MNGLIGFFIQVALAGINLTVYITMNQRWYNMFMAGVAFGVGLMMLTQHIIDKARSHDRI